LVQLMWGGLPPGVDGGLVNARLRYFDPERKRAGVPEDVAALVSQLTDSQTVVTLVNLNKTEPRTLVMQGGAYGEHQFESVTIGAGRGYNHRQTQRPEIRLGRPHDKEYGRASSCKGIRPLGKPASL